MSQGQNSCIIKVKAGLFFIMLYAVLFSEALLAQSLPVGTPVLEDYYRNLQLTGEVDSNISFTIRPLSMNRLNLSDSNVVRPTLRNWEFLNKKMKLHLLPVTWQAQYNTDHPYGWNDGPMIAAKGLQNVWSAGIFGEIGRLSLQLRPEVIIAGNPHFESILDRHYTTIAARYYDHYNYMDLPERFGDREYLRAYWGQSSVRFNFEHLSLGVSTENLWWGPGIRSSLVLSNNAPGFLHFTLNTNHPYKTKIGSFEGQFIGGRLEGSGFGPQEPERSYFGLPLELPKPDDWRYLSGVVLTYQPKWVPGLFLGITRSSQKYSKDLSGFRDYLPLFSSFNKIEADNLVKADSYSSLFFRWLWQQEHAEAYFEYGSNEQNKSFRDFLLEPGNSRAFIFGIKKSFPLGADNNEYLQLNFELTQLQQNSFENIQNFESWYENRYVRHGYTNRGQVLGAGIGPGSNLQSLEVSWLKGLKRVGIQVERYLHNNDFYYYAYEDSKDLRRHWYDLSLGLNSSWSYRNLILNGRATAIKSVNYGWYLDPANEVPNIYFINGLDAFNMQFQLGVMYRL
ncbi:MAG TPA: capsule assembly Wzi family protein [Emticicia sp.]